MFLLGSVGLVKVCCGIAMVGFCGMWLESVSLYLVGLCLLWLVKESYGPLMPSLERSSKILLGALWHCALWFGTVRRGMFFRCLLWFVDVGCGGVGCSTIFYGQVMPGLARLGLCVFDLFWKFFNKGENYDQKIKKN